MGRRQVVARRKAGAGPPAVDPRDGTVAAVTDGRVREPPPSVVRCHDGADGCRNRRGPRKPANQDSAQRQPWPHGHWDAQAQEAWVAAGAAPGLVAVWQPQRQDAPGQVVQAQGVACWVSFMADFLGCSTTGCRRWVHCRRDAAWPTGACDEWSDPVPDRSRTSTEWSRKRAMRVPPRCGVDPGHVRGPHRLSTLRARLTTLPGQPATAGREALEVGAAVDDRAPQRRCGAVAQVRRGAGVFYPAVAIAVTSY